MSSGVLCHNRSSERMPQRAAGSHAHSAECSGISHKKHPHGTAVGTSSLSASILNLGKAILGAGVLSLPSGIAGFTDSSVGIVPSTFLLALIGCVAAYSFQSIGSTCERFDARSFAEAWAKVVDKRYSMVLTAIVVVNTFLSCLAYSIVIGDSFSQIFAAFGLPPFLLIRNNVILLMTTCVLFPLSCLRKLDALKYTSIVGILGTFYCAIFMVIRYADHSYAKGGKFYSQISNDFRPFFDRQPVKLSEFLDMDVFTLLSMMSTAYVAHYNAPRVWIELRNPTAPRYNYVVKSAFGVAIVSYMVIMTMGFLTFGGNSAGFILNNYSNRDGLAVAARVAVGVGIICSYPLTFTALRDHLSELLGISEEAKERIYFFYLNIALFIVITSLSTRLHNVGLVVGFSGSLIGSLFIYVIPAVMNICAQGKQKMAVLKNEKGSAVEGSMDRMEIAANYGMMIFGGLVGVAGVVTNIHSAFFR